MEGLPDGMLAVEVMLRGGFVLVLAAAGFQDLKERRVHISIFIISGAVGTVLRGIQLTIELKALAPFFGYADLWLFAGNRLLDMASAIAVGGVLLAVSAVTGEAVGMADGYFFAVSGLYLGLVRNILLLCGGLFLCFLVCSVLLVIGICRGRNVRKVRIPFLPFLIPTGIGVMFL